MNMEIRFLGSAIREERKNQKISIRKLAELLAIEPAYIRMIENNYRIPSFSLFFSICHVLNVSPNYLLKGDFNYYRNNEFLALCEQIKDLEPQQIELICDLLEPVVIYFLKENTGE